MIITLPRLDVRRLAADFSEAVRVAHTETQLRAIIERNAAETDPQIDHVHDYIDANELMARAVALQGAYDWCDVAREIDSAWTKARLSGFALRRVLVACEFSGIVRDAFAERGHSVMSCDLLETESPGPHYIGDARDVMNDGWHLMIAHPPCTFLCNSGLKHLRRGGQDIDPERWDKMYEAAEFFTDLGAADVRHIARENPIPHGPAREIIGRPDQYVHPYEFGEDKSKKTGLWLKNLPQLTKDPAQFVAPKLVEYGGKLVKRWANQSPCGADNTPQSPERWRIRSRFFKGIADAMANQWCNSALGA